jgi:hypothetical protein
LLRTPFLATAAKISDLTETWLSVNIVASNESCQNFLEVSAGLILVIINRTKFGPIMRTEETVLQGMTGRLVETVRCYGMEMYVEKTKVIRISRQPAPTQIVIDHKQLENVEHFNSLGSMMTSDAGCKREIKCRIAIGKAAFNKKKALFTSKLGLNLRKKLVNCYIWSVALCGAETWALRKVELESFEMWCWRRTEKISWTDRVRNEEV